MLCKYGGMCFLDVVGCCGNCDVVCICDICVWEDKICVRCIMLKIVGEASCGTPVLN